MTEIECVYCAGGTKCLNIIQVRLSLLLFNFALD
jgi:hypothetical protein